MDSLFAAKKIVMIVLGALALVGFCLNMYQTYYVKPKQHIEKVVNIKDSILKEVEEHLNEPVEDQREMRVTETKRDHVVEEPKHEPFWVFYYKFLLEEDFRKTRFKTGYTEAENDYINHIHRYGDFVNQDSMTGRWLYTVKYKDYIVTMNFIDRQGKWYLESVD